MSQFVMLVGPAGSGKTTTAKNIRLQNPKIIMLSSDSLREMINGDASDQSNPQLIFTIMRDAATTSLMMGLDVIYDATNLSSVRRKMLLKWLRSHVNNVTATCIVHLTSLKECIERQKQRERKVPIEVIKRQYDTMQKPTKSEGWDEIINMGD